MIHLSTTHRTPWGISLGSLLDRPSSDPRDPLSCYVGPFRGPTFASLLGGGGSAPSTTFQLGDKVAYQSHGVAEVIGIEEVKVRGVLQRCYRLRLLESDSRVMVPLETAESTGLRPLVSETTVREIWDLLREPASPTPRVPWTRERRTFLAKLQSGSLFECAEVVRDLSRLRQEKTLSFQQRQMLDKTLFLLAQEIAVVTNHTVDEVRREIQLIFSS